MREILAVRKVLQSFVPKFAGLCIKWNTDNQNVARIISVGSRKSGLQAKLSVFLKFAFIMAFLLSLSGYPDPVMSKQII